jgi:hypothetical protein
VKRRDCFYAKTAFILSLGFWIPLFNIGLCVVSIYFAIKSLRLINKNSKRYGDIKYVIAALVLSITTIIVTVIGISIFALKQLKCG